VDFAGAEDLAGAGPAAFCDNRSANAPAGEPAASADAAADPPRAGGDEEVDDEGKEETCMHGVTFRVG
jgi:hypothetical protein